MSPDVIGRHQRLPDGTFRNSVYFGVIAEEWPAVRASLDAVVARAAAR